MQVGWVKIGHFRQITGYISKTGMTKYRKGPTKDPQRTAKEHYGLSCRKLAPIELNGALYSSAQRQTAPSVDVEISFFVSVIRSIGSPSLTGRRCQSRSGSASGTLCSRWHAKALLHGTQQSTSSLLMAA